jgi:molecular chaperone DnaJ
LKKKDKTYYQILGVNTDAITSDIKRAYRKIAKSSHPDLGHQHKSEEERAKSTEEMLIVNEAYETLVDKKKRASYDLIIGVTIALKQEFHFSKNTEDEARAIFLAKVFNPSRSSIAKVIRAYDKQIKELAQDPFDDELLADFENYLEDFEGTLSKASRLFSTNVSPSSLDAAVFSMRHCIAQAADALEEMRNFCRNYNYDHLTTAESLLRIAYELSKKAQEQTKIA